MSVTADGRTETPVSYIGCLCVCPIARNCLLCPVRLEGRLMVKDHTANMGIPLQIFAVSIMFALKKYIFWFLGPCKPRLGINKHYKLHRVQGRKMMHLGSIFDFRSLTTYKKIVAKSQFLDFTKIYFFFSFNQVCANQPTVHSWGGSLAAAFGVIER